jgi:hypothetical protein
MLRLFFIDTLPPPLIRYVLVERCEGPEQDDAQYPKMVRNYNQRRRVGSKESAFFNVTRLGIILKLFSFTLVFSHAFLHVDVISSRIGVENQRALELTFFVPPLTNPK